MAGFFSVFVHENRYFFDPRFNKMKILTEKMKIIFFRVRTRIEILFKFAST